MQSRFFSARSDSDETTTLEVIAVTVEDAMAAERGGADRIELVADLAIGGTTPPEHVIRGVARAVSIPVDVMIRPRGGDAVYGRDEIAVMVEAAHMAREAGADGIVTGASRSDGFVDIGVLTRIVEAGRLPTTFHNAFNAVPKARMWAALDELSRRPLVERVLTSAGYANAFEGRHALKRLVDLDVLSIMPGGGVTAANIAQLVRETGVTEVHVGSAARCFPEAPNVLRRSTSASIAADDVTCDAVSVHQLPVLEDAVRHLKAVLDR